MTHTGKDDTNMTAYMDFKRAGQMEELEGNAVDCPNCHYKIVPREAGAVTHCHSCGWVFGNRQGVNL